MPMPHDPPIPADHGLVGPGGSRGADRYAGGRSYGASHVALRPDPAKAARHPVMGLVRGLVVMPVAMMLKAVEFIFVRLPKS
jgi:hypothetical protein